MNRANRPNHQAFDEVRIKTVPRWKESELSGDEYRISAVIEFYIKGKMIHSRSWNRVETALQFGDWSWLDFAESGFASTKVEAQNLCDQEGCAEP
jgi:hypothetical protein